MKQKKKVGNLKKLSLSVHAGTVPDSNNLTPAPILSEFIFGLGTSGMAPFEYELSEKHEGDTFSLSLRPEDIPMFFEHLCICLPPLPANADTYYLTITIDKVSDVSASEVVKALAGSTGCGGGDCGCGCGGHH